MSSLLLRLAKMVVSVWHYPMFSSWSEWCPTCQSPAWWHLLTCSKIGAVILILFLKNCNICRTKSFPFTICKCRFLVSALDSTCFTGMNHYVILIARAVYQGIQPLQYCCRTNLSLNLESFCKQQILDTTCTCLCECTFSHFSLHLDVACCYWKQKEGKLLFLRIRVKLNF